MTLYTLSLFRYGRPVLRLAGGTARAGEILEASVLKSLLLEEFREESFYYKWFIEITADVRGVDLYRTYEIPMQSASPEVVWATEVEQQKPHADATADLTADAEADAREKADAVYRVALAELSIGRSVDAITDRLAGAGVAQDAIVAGLERIVREGTSQRTSSAQDWLVHRRQLQDEIASGQVMMLDRPATPVRTRHVAPPEAEESTAGSRAAAGMLLLVAAGYFLPDFLGFHNDERLMATVRDRDGDKVISLLEDGADPNIQNRRGTPLWMQATWGDQRILEIVLRASIDLELGDREGITPLNYFIQNRDRKRVACLLKLGADATARDPRGGGTPLHPAAWSGNPEIIRLLVQHGAEPDVRDNEGRTALDVAGSCRQTDNYAALKELL
jgi:hypothetical protein